MGGFQKKIEREKKTGKKNQGKRQAHKTIEKEFNRRKGTRENQINERKATETDRKRKKSQKHRNGNARKQKSMK